MQQQQTPAAAATTSPISKDVEIVDDDGHLPRLNEVSKKFINDCIAEKERLGNDFPCAALLIDEAIDRVQSSGRIPGREIHADVFKQKSIKVTQKVFVPVKQFPNFNFTGKILGPKGNSLRNLQKETLCRILIKGRTSVRDPKKEEELRNSGDPRHAHLNKDLYVEISTVATPAEAHARIAYALAEIRKYLIPDSNDEVSQSQRKELLQDPEYKKHVGSKFLEGNKARPSKPRVSILQKFTGLLAKADKMDFEEDSDIQEVEPTQAQPPQRRSIMKRSLPESSPYMQRRNVAEAPRVKSEGNNILRKITGFQGQLYNEAEEEPQEEYEYEPIYEDEQRTFSNGQPAMRQMSQRPTGKRFLQESPATFRRYENPQKRVRDSHPNNY